MAIPYNDNLRWDTYLSHPDWHKTQPEPTQLPEKCLDSQSTRAIKELFRQTFKQPFTRGVQCLRDAARLVLKVPFRSLKTPVFLKKNWKQRERAKINAKLAGYSFLHLLSVPVKFCVALAALAISAVSFDAARKTLDKSESWGAYLDGRASQLEALKEEGRQNAQTREEYARYKEWLYGIDPSLCR